MLPAVALIAHRPIAAGEELTFAYGQPNDGCCNDIDTAIQQDDGAGDNDQAYKGQHDGGQQEDVGHRSIGVHGNKARQCFCGTSACLGYLPADG